MATEQDTTKPRLYLLKGDATDEEIQKFAADLEAAEQDERGESQIQPSD